MVGNLQTGLYERLTHIGWYRPAETIIGDFTKPDGTTSSRYYIAPRVMLFGQNIPNNSPCPGEAWKRLYG